jgi:hypothetical protein
MELRSVGADAGVELSTVTNINLPDRMERYFKVREYVMYRPGVKALLDTVCSKSKAELLLGSRQLDLVPCINIITNAPVFTEHEGKFLTLHKGYYPQQGGILVKTNSPIEDIPLPKAMKELLGLLEEYDFVSPSDKSRAIAQILSPALRFGRLLGPEVDFPIDVAEADQNQSGKTYRLKVEAAIYNEIPYTIAPPNSKKGVGSLEESFSNALLSGRPMIILENWRGGVNCPMIETAIRGTGRVEVRVPYRANVEIETSNIIVMLSSNSAESTPDFASRMIISRIRRKPDTYNFKKYPEGDLLQHVRSNSIHYLSCVGAVLREYHKRGKPHSQETRHTFKDWVQSMDYIVQDMFRLAPLLDGHQEEQLRMGSKNLVMLRDICLVIERKQKTKIWLPTHKILGLCRGEIDLPQIKTNDPVQGARSLGQMLSYTFFDREVIKVEGFIVKRRTREVTAREGTNSGTRNQTEYLFRRR